MGEGVFHVVVASVGLLLFRLLGRHVRPQMLVLPCSVLREQVFFVVAAAARVSHCIKNIFI